MLYTYDVENRLTSASGENYGYDPSNKRIQKQLTNGTEEIHFYGARGERLGIYNLQYYYTGSPIYCTQTTLNVYFGGKLIERIGSNGGFVGLDRLGSDGRLNSYPWGEEKTTTTQNTEKFATYYRDGTGLDYADQRYYSSIMGRFLTADPADPYVGNMGEPNDLADDISDDYHYQTSTEDSGDPSNPQSWNRYAYVEGDPVNFYDPTGEVKNCPPGTHVENGFCVADPNSNTNKLPTSNKQTPRGSTTGITTVWIPGPGGGSPQTGVSQRQIMVQQVQVVRTWVVHLVIKQICKDNSSDRILTTMRGPSVPGSIIKKNITGGFIGGAITGAIVGIPEFGIGAIPGAVIGGVAGAGGGVFSGAAIAGACSTAGAYDSRPE
jgi:RHS repeat-associated protein